MKNARCVALDMHLFSRMKPRRAICSLLGVLVIGVAFVAPSRRATAQQAGEGCNAWDVDYALAAKLQLSETPHGAGNGTYVIGPGSMTLRFENENGQPGGTVRMRAYAMRESFAIESHTAFWTTHLLTDSKTQVTPDACGDVAKGELGGGQLRWTTNLTGYRTDGTIDCDGSLCGSFGAPQAGKSALHLPPHNVSFSPFQFAPDMKTFSMPVTFVSKSENPKQTAQITLSGREARRTCVKVPPCP